jgi:hypothetical protein
MIFFPYLNSRKERIAHGSHRDLPAPVLVLGTCLIWFSFLLFGPSTAAAHESTATEMRREVVYDPLPSGLKFHLLNTRFKGFSGPVGSGKTEALCQEALRLAYVNGPLLGLIGAPTYRMLADVTRMKFLEFLERNEIPHTFHKSDNSLYLDECGAKIIFRSLDQPTRLVGTTLAWFALDELTYSKEDSWRRLEARLREPRAVEPVGCAVWTPKGFDWVWKRFIGPEKVAGYGAIFAKPRENHHLPPEFYDSLKASYDERFYAQEVEGKYLAVFAGQAYYTFDRDESVKPLPFDRRAPLLWSLDFNIDPACSVIGQLVDVTTREEALRGIRREHFHVLDELSLPDTRTVEHVERFLKVIDPLYDEGLGAIRVYGDASGDARKSSSLKTDWQQVKDLLRSNARVPVTYHVPSANPPVRGRIATVAAMLRNAHGERRMFIDPKCKGLIMDLEQVAWKRDSAGTPLDELDKSDPKRTHLSDALGYAVWATCRPHQPGPQSQPLFGGGR